MTCWTRCSIIPIVLSKIFAGGSQFWAVSISYGTCYQSVSYFLSNTGSWYMAYLRNSSNCAKHLLDIPYWMRTIRGAFRHSQRERIELRHTNMTRFNYRTTLPTVPPTNHLAIDEWISITTPWARMMMLMMMIMTMMMVSIWKVWLDLHILFVLNKTLSCKITPHLNFCWMDEWRHALIWVQTLIYLNSDYSLCSHTKTDMKSI